MGENLFDETLPKLITFLPVIFPTFINTEPKAINSDKKYRNTNGHHDNIEH